MDEIEEIKRRLDIIELISSYLTLKKAGANYKALCPFHQEKTPSLMVSPEKQIFKCFGCSESGDIFSFVMKMENLEFREALKMLAERAGVKLKSQRPKPGESPERKTQLYKINHFSALVFQKILISHPAGKKALNYLEKRKISLQTMKDFKIGYAPQAKVLSQLLLKRGYRLNEITSAGSPDRFFKRIIFPISDPLGNVVGFTGRALEIGQEPKYLNTSETIIFHKGRILYNLFQARGPIKQAKATVVVEGQMDVVASHQAGVKNVVATSGTALTEEHLKVLNRYTPNIIFAFDSDTAGTIAAKRAYEMAIAQGMNVKMALLGDFKDPGEMIVNNPNYWREAIQKPVGMIDWYFKLAFEKRAAGGRAEELSSQEKKEIAREILPIIKIIPDRIEQAHFVNLLAKKLSVSEEAIFDVLGQSSIKTAPGKSAKATAFKRTLTNESLLLGILLWRPEKIKKTLGQIDDSNFQDKRMAAIYNQLLKVYNKDKQKVLERLREKIPRDLKILLDTLILEVENLYQDDQSQIEEDLSQALNHLKKNQKEALKTYYAREIKLAEEKKDWPKLKKLMREFQDAISK